MWGFTVDDALISIRYAHHLATGAGYRFNIDGPVTDGVTPLPWAFLIVPLSAGSMLRALVWVKVLGMIMAAVAAGLVGSRPSCFLGRATALVLLLTCLPLGAYSASGMETPLAVLLCVAACRWPLLGGLAAAVRPELLPWAATLGCGFALARKASPLAVLVAALGAALPFAVCALVRLAVFGHMAPLAVQAKPSDLAHGVVYVAAALLASGLFVLAVAPRALPRATAESRVIAVAFGVHVVAVALAGGDSMPYARLLVPVLPTLLLVHLDLATLARPWATWLRTGVALGLSSYVLVVAAPRGRHVMQQRAELIASARPLLGGAKRIATVDVGWVSVASDDAHIVDLAGLTDPEIAALPGGHTSKRVSGSMLVDRHVDTLVLYDAHLVTERLLDDPVTRAHFKMVAELPHYAVFIDRARSSPPSEEGR
jgi:hypothetical protein